MNIGIVGATGVVGQTLLPILEERKIPVSELRLFASEKSTGKTLQTPFGERVIQLLSEEGIRGLDAIFFAADAKTSAEWCPKAVREGIFCIDKSSYFRMDSEVPLVVPEVNGESIGNSLLVANPNCTTSIAAVVLWPIHQELGLRRVIISTYQAASGAGKPAMEELEAATRARLNGEPFVPREFAHDLSSNLIPLIDTLQPNDYSAEEMKVRNELRKIFGLPELPVGCTAVRVPIPRAHSEVADVETIKPFITEEVREILRHAPGVEVRDDPSRNIYPMPKTATGKDDVEAGRIRQSLVFDNGGTLFICGDQLRKGAALNAVQILEWVISRKAHKK